MRPVYILEPALLKQLSQLRGASDESAAYKFTIGFYDESNNEVFSADSTIGLAITINGGDVNSSSEAKTNQDILTRASDPSKRNDLRMGFPKDTLFKITTRTVTAGTTSWLEIIHVQTGKSYWVERAKVKEVFDLNDEGSGNIINYLPSLNMTKPPGALEALKHRFTVTLTVPQELFEQVKTIRITPLKPNPPLAAVSRRCPGCSFDP